MPQFYECAEKLISMEKAYVCFCKPETWRELTRKKLACPHRQKDPFDPLAQFPNTT